MRYRVLLLSAFISIFAFPNSLFAQTISGSILDASDNPVGGGARLFLSSGEIIGDLWVDGEGNFQSWPLANGSYHAVTVHTHEMLDEAWENFPCENLMCNVQASTPIVISGSDVTGIDFVLDPIMVGGHIVGAVEDSTNSPLADVGIQIRNAAGEHLIHINTGPDGSYQTPLLANDTYFVKTVGEPFGLGRELYDDYRCLPPDICEDPAIITTKGTPVVISGMDEIGIDFELTVPSGAMISGQVTDADIGIVLPDVHMNLLNVSNDYVANTDTDALGNYYFSGLVDGTYKVYAVNVPDGYTGELYGGDHCHEWNCDLNNSGTTIIISGGVPAPGKNIMLDFSGTRLLGTITRSDSGAPVSAQYAHMGVDLFSDIGEYMGTWPTNRAGQYQVLLAAGNYYLAAVNDWRHHGLINEVWEDIQCTEFCDPVALHGTLINVADGASVVADFELDPGFELSGAIRVEGNLTGDGAVNIWDSSGLLFLTGWNDGGGYWTSNPLPAGTYYATVHGEYFGMESQLFDGLSCAQEYCDVTAGTPIVVTDAPIDGIDFNLSPFSEDWTISGSMRDPGGHPVYGAMRLFDPFGNHVLDAGTDHAANFQTQNLANGTYFAITINTYEMLDEAWDNIPCENMICDIPGSTPIVVNGSDVSGIDFVLEPITGGGMITGLVKDGSDAPLPDVLAVIRNRNGEYIWEVWTLPDGSYQTPLLANDSYFVHTHNEPFGLGRELYDDIPCIPADNCDDPGYVSAYGTEVVINEADEGGIDFSLEMPEGAVISGQIIDADTGFVLPDVHMNLLDESGNYLANTNSDPAGNYYFSGLLDGSYKVYAVDVPHGYTGELYGGDHCHHWNCDLEVSGTPILVSGGTSVSGRDIVLDYSGTRLLGTITRSDTGAPVSAQYAHVGVDLFNDGGEYLGTWATNSAGQYQVNLPGAGSYYLAATNDWDFHSLINEAWNDIKCWDCNPMALGATLIPISDGATVVADFVLDPGYKLSGTIRVEGSLTEHGHVNIWDDTGQFLISGGNDGGGDWTGYPLPAGTYYATAPGEHFGVVTELYDDFSCPQEFCDVTTGTPIVITDSDVGNINFDLAPASFDWTISGSIRDGGGNPVGGAVRFFNPFGNTLFTVWVDELGNFLTPSLADGTYYAITMRTNGTLDEAWKDFPCVNRICDKTAGTPIVVAGSDVIGINFVLAPITVGGHLSGLVEDSTFTPLPDVGIVVRNSNGDWLFRVVTGADGRFNTSLLTNDTYFLHTRDEPFGLARELYDDYPCPLFSGCGDRDFILTNGTPVVMNGSDQTDIDFMLELPVGGIISGRVSDANIGIPLPDVHVALLDSNNNQIWGRLTDSLGDYYFAGLPDGAYKVFADDVPEGYTEELFGGDHCPDRNCDFNISGTPITIDGGAPADDKNIDLDYTGTRLLGTLTRSDTGAPVSSQYGEAGVELFNAAGEFMDSRLTNGAGQFQINLTAGDYYLVSVSDWDHHQLINEAWDNIKCHQDCDPLAVGATLISVPENHSVVADFDLDPEVIFKNSFEGQ